MIVYFCHNVGSCMSALMQITMNVQRLRITTASMSVPTPLVLTSAIVMMALNWMKMDYDVNVSACIWLLDNCNTIIRPPAKSTH